MPELPKARDGSGSTEKNGRADGKGIGLVRAARRTRPGHDEVGNFAVRVCLGWIESPSPGKRPHWTEDPMGMGAGGRTSCWPSNLRSEAANMNTIQRFCEPHLRRTGEKIPAARVVAGTPMCLRCFRGSPIPFYIQLLPARTGRAASIENAVPRDETASRKLRAPTDAVAR